jgi:cytidylate kinase
VPKEEEKRMSLITITCGIGTGGAAVARQVAETLGITLYDDDRLQDEAVRMGIRSADLKSLDEKAPGLFDRILSRQPGHYVAFMESVVFEVARSGKGVILGHGSQILLRDFGCALHVLVTAGQNTRVANLLSERGINRETAEKLIEKSDSEKRGFFRFAFHRELSDPALYDLVASTEKMGIDLSARLIVEAARSDEISTCGLNALMAMERMGRKKKIEAVLQKKNLNLTLIHIEVDDDGRARVSGAMPNKEERRQLIAALKELPGDLDIEVDVIAMPAGV